MIYRTLIRREKWTIYSLCDADGNSQVLNFLESYKTKNLGARMLAIIDRVAEQGPPRDDDLSKKVGKYAFEFRRAAHPGPGLRVLYFYDEQRVVICTFAFEKTNRAPKGAYDACDADRDRYMGAKAKGRIVTKD